MPDVLQRDLAAYVDARTDRLVRIAQDLVRLPSENRAPAGAEAACQQYIAGFLRRCGWAPSLYTPAQVPGLSQHPLFWPGRDYTDRPNLAAVRRGRGNGRSLLLSGHIDTVPIGSARWSRDPFGGEIDGNRLYGRGANDMKGGVAANLFVVEALAELGVELNGDLTWETVVDEEFGGVNGTLAGRLAGYRADAAIISEPSSLRVCPAQRGGRTVHLTFSAPNDGILAQAGGSGVVDQLRVFFDAVPQFAALRRAAAPRHPLYQHLSDPVPVTVARIHTAPWGTSEPPNVPSQCQVELFWQAMPGEALAAIDAQFSAWFGELLARHPQTFPQPPSIEHPIRWLPGSSLAPQDSFAAEFAGRAVAVLGREPAVAGIEGPCDLYVFHEFGIPALLWGASGGNTHMPDEYVEIDTLAASAKVLLSFVCHWCGVRQA